MRLLDTELCTVGLISRRKVHGPYPEGIKTRTLKKLRLKNSLIFMIQMKVCRTVINLKISKDVR